MSAERVAIKNRHGLKLVIQVDAPESPSHLAFIVHGQGGFKEQKQIQAFADAFLENDFRVVRFDATHSIGESEGDIMDVTYTGYIEDLEDVITWSRGQSWFKEPFALAGHSMGGFTAAYYAEVHPEEVLCLAPISAVINYGLTEESHGPEFMKAWREQGYRDEESKSKPGVIKRIGWGNYEDLKKYDLLQGADKLTMPVLLMAGDKDRGTPYEHQRILFDAIPGDNKKIVEVKDADHNFRGSGNYDKKLAEIEKIMSDWLKDLK